MMEKQKQLITEIMNEDAKDGLYKQQTAVEWLLTELRKHISQFDKAWESEIRQAKQMEREQIEKAYKAGYDDGVADYFDEKFKDGKDYYTKTYGE